MQNRFPEIVAEFCEKGGRDGLGKGVMHGEDRECRERAQMTVCNRREAWRGGASDGDAAADNARRYASNDSFARHAHSTIYLQDEPPDARCRAVRMAE